MTLEPLRVRLGRPVRRNERGASAIVVALLMTALMAAGALGLDISKLVFERQQVRAAVDAAAQIGAVKLPPSGFLPGEAAALVTDIKKAAVANYGSSTYGPGLTTGNVVVDGVTVPSVGVDFYCVVANTSKSSATASPDTTQIPSTCLPDPADYTKAKCSATSCAIPCFPLTKPTAVCNAVKVTATKQVQFVLAPAIGIRNGKAEASTVSCQGSCGGPASPKPMNVVVMADRTPSMWGNPPSSGSTTNLDALRSGIENMLKIMTPNQQYVAFGALHQSTTVAKTTGADDLTQPQPSGANIFTETTIPKKCDGWKSSTHTESNCNHWTTKARTNQFAGTWVPVGFTKTYLNSDRTLNTTEDLYASVHKLTYSNLKLTNTYGTSAQYLYSKMLSTDDTANTITGTHLASALKGAARYLLANVDHTTNLVAGLDDGFRADLITKHPDLKIQNVIIFETDGEPYEAFDDATDDSASPLLLNNADDIGSINVPRACRNLQKVADEAKAEGIQIITIGFGSVNNTMCSGSLSAASMLASAASTKTAVNGSGAAESDCSTPAESAAENSDSDYYYCATSTTDLTSVFKAAMGDMNKQTKFMSIDGVGD